MKQQTQNKMENKNNNPMREIQVEKMVLNCGGIEDKLEKSVKLLEMITKKKVQIIKSRKRIPTFGISPGKKSGCKVTLRDKKEIDQLAKRLFAAVDNKIPKKNITRDNLSFKVRE
jgi:ribosomal protein L5